MKYIERLIDSVYLACKESGFDVDSPEVNDIASKTIILFLSSPVYKEIFSSFKLVVSDNKALTHIAEVDSNSIVKERYVPFSWKYDYCDDNSEPWDHIELTGAPSLDTSELDEHDFININKVIDSMPEDLKNTYKLDRANPIKYKILPPGQESTSFIASQGGLSNPFNYGYVKHQLGIKGYSSEDDRTYVIAYNEVGTIGILNIFHNTLDNNDNENLSISMISVSPFYKGRGIASHMTDVAVNYAKTSKKAIIITSPTKEGKEHYYPKMIERYGYKDLLFIEPSINIRFEKLLSSNQTYERKVKEINRFKKFLDRNFNGRFDLSKKMELNQFPFTALVKLAFHSDGIPAYKIAKEKNNSLDI